MRVSVIINKEVWEVLKDNRCPPAEVMKGRCIDQESCVSCSIAALDIQVVKQYNTLRIGELEKERDVLKRELQIAEAVINDVLGDCDSNMIAEAYENAKAEIEGEDI